MLIIFSGIDSFNFFEKTDFFRLLPCFSISLKPMPSARLEVRLKLIQLLNIYNEWKDIGLNP